MKKQPLEQTVAVRLSEQLLSQVTEKAAALSLTRSEFLRLSALWGVKQLNQTPKTSQLAF